MPCCRLCRVSGPLDGQRIEDILRQTQQTLRSIAPNACSLICTQGLLCLSEAANTLQTAWGLKALC